MPKIKNKNKYINNNNKITKTTTTIVIMNERNELFYLTTHSTHFSLRLYGVGYSNKVKRLKDGPPSFGEIRLMLK